MQFAHAMVLPGRTSFSQSILIAGLNYVSNAVVTVPSLFDVPSKTPIMPNQKMSIFCVTRYWPFPSAS